MRGEHKMSGDEVNAFTGWRHFYLYLRRPGARKKVKQISHRKDRRAARRAAAKEWWESDDSAW